MDVLGVFTVHTILLSPSLYMSLFDLFDLE